MRGIIMKKDWEIKKLGEVCEVVGGSTPKTNQERYWGGKHYWVSPSELDGSKFIFSTLRTITDEGVKSAHLQLLPVGTVLLSSRAPIGKVAITKGVGQPGISVSIINEMPLILPPLPLQQEFAKKIEAIEKQKELLKRSIKEVETLFDARMDYYFGDT